MAKRNAFEQAKAAVYKTKAPNYRKLCRELDKKCLKLEQEIAILKKAKPFFEREMKKIS